MVRVAARGLITDPAGRWLLIQPPGKNWWHLPGGGLEDGELPTLAARREVREEIGLELEPGRLLLVSCHMPRPPATGKARMSLVFDMGILPAGATDQITGQDGEVARWSWMAPHEAVASTRPLLSAGLRQLAEGADAPVVIEHYD